MNSAEDIIPFEEMCWHARHSLLVNGLRPKEWRWGRDAIAAFKHYQTMMTSYMVACHPHLCFPKEALLIWQELPVFPMRASGVACIAGHH